MSTWRITFLKLKKNLTSQQYSANISCKTFLFSDAFRPTAVDFFKEFYKLILQASIYKL